MRSGLRHLLLALLLAALAVVPARAEVSGSAEWSWADFSRKSSAPDDDLDASHFMQTYSLLYSGSGEFNAGRAGYWKSSVGYEWASLNTSVNDLDATVDSGKILYSGDLLFAPGGLPFRLQAFSYDMTRAFPSGINQGRLLAPNIAVDLGAAGQQIVTGVTLLAGIKNGSYLGQYRESLSKVPRLLIDYRETYTRNLDSLRQEHTRLRDLAFVSLNKKDNWFHYRVHEYEDFEDPSNNYEERTYMLGTVDHTMARQWINLTNWIQLSVDGSLEQEQAAGIGGVDTYALNLFTRFNRRDWTASNFTRYERTVDRGDDRRGGALNKRLEIPVFASGQIDPRNKWRLSLVNSSEEDSADGVGALPLWNEYLSYINFQLETLRDSGLILTYDTAFDMKRGSLGDEGQALKVGIEGRTDRRRDLATVWVANYDLAVFQSMEIEGDYFEQRVGLGIDHQLDPAVMVGGKTRFALGFGEYQAESTDYLKPALSGRVDARNYSDDNIDGTSWRSQSELYLEVLSPSRWKNRFSMAYDHIDRGGEVTSNLQLTHIASYSTNSWWVNFDTRFESGDETDATFDATALGGIKMFEGSVDQSLTHKTTLNYAPQRNWQLGGEAAVTWAKGDRGNGALVHLMQNSSYSLFSSGGTKRRVMTFEQTLVYETLFGDVNGSPWYAELNLVSTWYAFRFLTLGTRGQFRHYGDSGANVVEYGLNAEVPFDKFYVNISYEYGYAEEGWDLRNPELTEHRWGVDVKKTF